MLRGATFCLSLGLAGCLWEPVQLAPTPGNEDIALVIETATPPSNDLFLSNFQGDSCIADVALPAVYFPRDVPLQASFFLNFPTNSEPLSIDGQTKFDLQPSQLAAHTYSLGHQRIRIDDFASDFNGHTNVLQVFVSDDLVNCPNPSVRTPGVENLLCTTTSWVWVIEPFGCPVL